MTTQEQEWFGQLNVLAETDLLANHLVMAIRLNWREGPMPHTAKLLELLVKCVEVNASTRAQLVEAESLRPRIYFLEKPDVCPAPGLPPTGGPEVSNAPPRQR